ncbi:MAG: sigma-70 family RNA polymerase sigma factor [Acidobacteriota bacterium]
MDSADQPAKGWKPGAEGEALGLLVGRAQRGDRGAFEELYRLHVDRVFGLCLRMTGDAGRAEEATQEVFVKAWRRLSQFRGESALSSWLYRMAVNTVYGTQRSTRRRQDRVLPVPDLEAMEPEAPASTPSSAGVDLRRALAQLPERARRVFQLHDVEGYRHRDVAQLLGISVGTSKSTLHRARKMLREVLS